MTTPKLIENGTRYFFQELLSKHHQRRVTLYHQWINVVLFLAFMSVIGGWLIWRYSSKPTPDELDSKRKQTEQYLADRMAEWKMSEERRERKERLERAGFDGYLDPTLANSSTNLITGLPAYQNDLATQPMVMI